MDEPSEFVIYEDCSTLSAQANNFPKDSPLSVYVAANQNIHSKTSLPITHLIKDEIPPLPPPPDLIDAKGSCISSFNILPSNILQNSILTLQDESVLQDENRNKVEDANESVIPNSYYGSFDNNGTYKLLLTPVQYSNLFKNSSSDKISSHTLLNYNSSDNSNDILVEDSLCDNENSNKLTFNSTGTTCTNSKSKKNSSQTQVVVKLLQDDLNFDMVEIISPHIDSSQFYEILEKESSVNKSFTTKELYQCDKEVGVNSGTLKLVSHNDVKLLNQFSDSLGNTIIYDPINSILHNCSTCNKQFSSELLYNQHKKECISYSSNVQKNIIFNEKNLIGEGTKVAFAADEINPLNFKTCWQCLICSEKFDSTSNLKNHYSSHTIEELSLALLKCTLPVNVQNIKSCSPDNSESVESKKKCSKLENSTESNKENNLNSHSFVNKSKGTQEETKDNSEISPNIGKDLLKISKLKPVTKYKPKRKSSESGLKSRDPHSCHVCKKVLSSRGNLAKHLIQHETVKPWMCKICGVGFNSKRNHDHHYVQRHTSLRPNVCSVCGKGYSNKQALTEHMIFHKKEKEFKCQYCNKSFRTKKCVKRHVQRHETNRKFVCDLCHKAFRVKVDLISHIRLVHNFEKKKNKRLSNSKFFLHTNDKNSEFNDYFKNEYCKELSYNEDQNLKKSHTSLENTDTYSTNEQNMEMTDNANNLSKLKEFPELLQTSSNSILSDINGEFKNVNLRKDKDPLFVNGESIGTQPLIPVAVTSDEQDYSSSYSLTLHNKTAIINQDVASPGIYVMIGVNEGEALVQNNSEKNAFNLSHENKILYQDSSAKVMNNQEMSGIGLLPSVLENITRSFQEGISVSSKLQAKIDSNSPECQKSFIEIQASDKNISTNDSIPKVGDEHISRDNHTQTLNLDLLSQTLQFDFQSSQSATFI